MLAPGTSTPLPSACPTPLVPDKGMLLPGVLDCSEDPSAEVPESWYPQQIPPCSLLTLLLYDPPRCLKRVYMCVCVNVYLHTHVYLPH